MSAPHIFRWDMDKTYLKTEFDTFKDLLRTAFQKPADKTNDTWLGRAPSVTQK